MDSVTKRARAELSEIEKIAKPHVLVPSVEELVEKIRADDSAVAMVKRAHELNAMMFEGREEGLKNTPGFDQRRQAKSARSVSAKG